MQSAMTTKIHSLESELIQIDFLKKLLDMYVNASDSLDIAEIFGSLTTEPSDDKDYEELDDALLLCPSKDDQSYQINPSFFDKIFRRDKIKKQQLRLLELYQSHYEQWVQATENKKKIIKEREETLKKREDIRKKKREELETAYYERTSTDITVKILSALLAKHMPSLPCIPKSHSLEYKDSVRTLVLNFNLPSPENIPTLVSYRQLVTTGELREKRMTNTAIERFYDEILYKICLGSIHMLFAADMNDSYDSAVFNGHVDFIDKATGKESSAFIMSLQATKEEFSNINLLQVDPKLCFKSLKGVGSSKLYGITPIRPILNISKDDSRFVDGLDVVDSLDAATNLASIDWQEFEHLIRQIFDKEFSQNGGEVKITQASRDGGVDAVAFDNDPIRGGKIVIQAKRYTNTVGVSAVRDLFGTVMNEGAMKGILVTTSDFGPDAHSFAKGKPLTLISGAELLYLFQKHGYEAKIDIRAAKELAAKQ